MTPDEAAARLARPGLTPLVEALAQRFGAGDEPVRVTVRDLDRAGQEALADLLGEERLRGTSPRVPVARLVAALGLADVDQLRAAVERHAGPLGNRRAEAAASRQAREGLWSWFEGEVARLDLPWDPAAREGWVGRLRSWGVRGGVDRHRRRLGAVLEVLRRLPADGVALPVLAEQVLADPHGLDTGRSVTALVLDALATAGFGPPATDAEAARTLWEAVGVAPDPLSSTVLVLGLRPPGDDPLAAFLRAAADAHEPVVVTLAQLRRWPLPPLPRDAVALVVENPSLVLSASGAVEGAVLICSSGRPTVAVVTLLRQLTAGGAIVRQHADFDVQGLQITRWLTERAGTRPWRMTAAAYRRATARPRDRVALSGEVPATPWDPALAEAMSAAGQAVYEEELVEDLLAGLQAQVARRVDDPLGAPEGGRLRWW